MAKFNDSYPVRLRGDLDASMSRWSWLIKWLLLIPHYIVLFFLYIAFFVVTVIAFFAILFTGRYPRSLFDFGVGVLRWSWRVSFYGYSALGTDKYPPFSLRSADYPADFDVDYPERLSRGLVLVKWWLLAIPHYLVIAAIVSGMVHLSDDFDDSGSATIPPFGVLVVIIIAALLFTGRYPRGLFDFLLGINRWMFRVRAYALLFRDEYPPFRLDQGPREPGAHSPPTLASLVRSINGPHNGPTKPRRRTAHQPVPGAEVTQRHRLQSCGGRTRDRRHRSARGLTRRKSVGHRSI